MIPSVHTLMASGYDRGEFSKLSKERLLDYIEQQTEQLNRFETRFRGKSLIYPPYLPGGGWISTAQYSSHAVQNNGSCLVSTLGTSVASLSRTPDFH